MEIIEDINNEATLHQIENDESKDNEVDGKRKRNRVIKKGGQIIEGTQPTTWLQSDNFAINTALKELEGMFLHFFSNKEDFLKRFTKETSLECLRKLSVEIIRLSSKVIATMESNKMNLEKISNLQEEKIKSHSHGMNEQMGVESVKEGGSINSYLEVTRRNVNTVMDRTNLPPPLLPNELKHSPSEKVIIIKAEKKGSPTPKALQEQFKKKLRETIGDNLAREVAAIRPTQQGGYVIINRTETARNEISAKIKSSGLIHETRMIVPLKKFAKLICRNVPQGTDTVEVLRDMFGNHNPQLAKIPIDFRKADIKITRIGWIFEVSSHVAVSIEAQGSRIRFGFGNELRMEEHIPLQQCYRCCRFGHNAQDCTGSGDICRLCAAPGHCGRECPYKNDRSKWKCHNCIDANLKKGMKCNVSHAAAQMHKCSVAEHEKNIKRIQLASAGIYTLSSNNKVATGKENTNWYENKNEHKNNSNNTRYQPSKGAGSNESQRNNYKSRNSESNINIGNFSSATLFASLPSSSSFSSSKNKMSSTSAVNIFSNQKVSPMIAALSSSSSAATPFSLTKSSATSLTAATPSSPASSSSSTSTSSSSSYNPFSVPRVGALGRTRSNTTALKNNNDDENKSKNNNDNEIAKIAIENENENSAKSSAHKSEIGNNFNNESTDNSNDRNAYKTVTRGKGKGRGRGRGGGDSGSTSEVARPTTLLRECIRNYEATHQLTPRENSMQMGEDLMDIL